MSLDRIQPIAKLGVRLYDRLEQMILDGHWKAGDRLPTESELCQQLGVSRSALREALQQLKGRGLLEATAGRGMFIRSMTLGSMERQFALFAHVQDDPEMFLELTNFRLMMEPFNARHAARSESKAFREQLKFLLSEMQSNLENLPAFIEADLDMHLLIANEAGNRFVKLTMCSLKPLSSSFGRISHNVEIFVAQTLKEHQAIVRAILKHDEQKAMQVMQKHLESSLAHYQKHLSSSSQQP